MPVTLTVTGTQSILGSLAALQEKIKSPVLVQKIADMASEVMADAAPKGRRGSTAGQLSRALSEVSVVENTGDGWRIGVGNMEDILPLPDPPDKPIANFLRLWALEKGLQPREPGANKAGKEFNPRKAWWYLSPEQKNRLREMREEGKTEVGGANPYRPFYWYVQDQGSDGAEITGSGYIAEAVRQISQRIPGIIRDDLRELRSAIGRSKFTRLDLVRGIAEREGFFR